MKTFIKTALIVGAIGGFAIGASAQSTCPSIAPYQCNSGTCVNDASMCNRTGMGGLSGSTSSSGSTGSGDLLSTNLSDKCSGNLRVDLQATQACAALAEKQGKALGYDIKCSTEKRTDVLAKNAVPIGERDAYFSTCYINGSPDGYDPVSLVGYKDTGSGVTLYDNFLGTTQAYGSGYNVNSMWYALPCDLANAASGQSGVLQSAVTCTKGAQEFFGASNPAGWRVDTYQQKTGKSTTTSWKTSTTTSGAGTINPNFNPYVTKLMEAVNQLLLTARSLYGTAAQNTSGGTGTNTTSQTGSNGGSTNTSTKTLFCLPDSVTASKYSPAIFTAINGDKTFSTTYNWSAPGSTKTSGQGRDFSTTYASAGTYTITVTAEGKSDTCQAVINN